MNAHLAPRTARSAGDSTLAPVTVLRMLLCTLLGVLLIGVGAPAAEAEPLPYRIAAQATMPGAGYGVAVDENRGLVYVAGRFNGAVFVFDEADLSLVGTIPVPNQPINLTVGPTGLVYVAQYTDTNVQGSVTVIDPDDRTVIATVPVGKSPVGLIVSHDGKRLFVCNTYSSHLTVFDLTDPRSPAVQPDVPLPSGSETPTLSPDGATLFLATNSSRVLRVDVASGAVQNTWTGFSYTHQVAISPDGTRAFISQQLGGEMPVFDVASNARIGTIPLLNTYYQSTDPALNTGFVTQPFASGGSVAVIDATTGALQQSLPGVNAAFYIATDTSTHASFVTSYSQLKLTKIEPVSPTVTVDPAPQDVSAGDTATFSAEATGIPPVSAQWQRSADGGLTWTDIEGATSPSYTTPETSLDDDGAQFRAVFADQRGVTDTSSAATLRVAAVPVAVTEQPESTSVVAGASAHFRVAATGTEPIQVQWQRSSDAGENWTDIPGAVAVHLDLDGVELSANGDRFRAVLTGPGVDNTATTAEATLTVTRAPDPDPDPDPKPPTPEPPTPPSPGAVAPTPPADGPRSALGATGSESPVLVLAVGGGLVVLGAVALMLRRRRLVD